MCPEFPNLTKCQKCGTILWLSKMKEVQACHWDNDTNSPWQKSEYATFLSPSDYHEALDMGLAENLEEELFIRQRLWWAYNDRKRNRLKLFNDKGEKLLWMDNLRKLEPLYDQSNVFQRLSVAEIRRNLGDFDGCIALLQSIEEDDLIWIKEALLKECKRRNRYLIVLNGLGFG